MTKSTDRRWVAGLATVLCLLTSLPYLMGYTVQGEDWWFTGFVFGVEDGNSYIAKMLSGAAGSWLFRTPYTTEPQNGFLAYFPYLLLGKLTSPPAQHEQLVVLFHIYRLVGIYLVCFATYAFLGFVIPVGSAQRWGTLLVTGGGGLGWLLLFTNEPSLPLEFYSPETFGFLSLFGLPHLAVARAFLLWGFLGYLSGEPHKIPIPVVKHLPDWTDPAGLVTGVFLLGLGFLQPLTVLVAWLVIGAHLAVLFGWGIWRPKFSSQRGSIPITPYLRRAFWAVAVSLPMVIYNVLSFSLDPFLSQWAAQNRIISPSPVFYLFAYGLVTPFAVWGGYKLLKLDFEKGAFLSTWALLLPFLTYAPYNLQRRLPEGGWVALCTLAVFAICANALQSGNALRRYLLPILTLFSLPAAFLLIIGGLTSVRTPSQPVFRTAAQVRVFLQLAESSANNAIILSSYTTGNVLPAWAPVRVVIGHGPESANLSDLLPRVNAFYQSTAMRDDERLAFLDEFDVDYVYWGDDERKLGDWDPHSVQFLEQQVEENGEAVFRVLAEN